MAKHRDEPSPIATPPCRDRPILSADLARRMAWEFLRRNPGYQADVKRASAGRSTRRRWGLAALVDPDGQFEEVVWLTDPDGS